MSFSRRTLKEALAKDSETTPSTEIVSSLELLKVVGGVHYYYGSEEVLQRWHVGYHGRCKAWIMMGSEVEGCGGVEHLSESTATLAGGTVELTGTWQYFSESPEDIHSLVWWSQKRLLFSRALGVVIDAPTRAATTRAQSVTSTTLLLRTLSTVFGEWVSALLGSTTLGAILRGWK